MGIYLGIRQFEGAEPLSSLNRSGISIGHMGPLETQIYYWDSSVLLRLKYQLNILVVLRLQSQYDITVLLRLMFKLETFPIEQRVSIRPISPIKTWFLLRNICLLESQLLIIHICTIETEVSYKSWKHKRGLCLKSRSNWEKFSNLHFLVHHWF